MAQKHSQVAKLIFQPLEKIKDDEIVLQNDIGWIFEYYSTVFLKLAAYPWGRGGLYLRVTVFWSRTVLEHSLFHVAQT